MSASLPERPRIGVSNTVFKSGPLFISSKGLGWKSWKKRWFILTRTSLVFFKNDPSALPQRGGEVNITLGGIDLNNSGSVVVREDKKLLTVLFPDGRDGRAFTLKAETSEDLYEWKTALEHALAQAPSAALVIGHNGIFRNDANDTIEGSFHQWRDKRPVKSMVVGRPILLALEDIDGGPSFLEKALRFLEKFGTKVEGILRQAADVEEVDRRVEEYEQGKNEFGPDEDAHVVGDCVKHVLRELPSSPVPASCCTALLEAYKIDRKEARVNAMRSAMLETFPEPNRRLLQRILKMMHTISLHASENRMTPSAVAACMAPLLLRPLLAGECELEDDFDVNGDNSAQLLAAANAANNAQAIITTLLEEYENIFDDDNLHRCSISADSRIENSASEVSSDDENLDIKDNGYHDAENEVDPDTDDDPDRILSGKLSESSGYAGSDLYEYKAFGGDDSDVGSPRINLTSTAKSNPPVDSQSLRESDIQLNEQQGQQKPSVNEMDSPSIVPGSESHRSMGEILSAMDQGLPQSVGPESCVEKSMNKLTNSTPNVKRSTFWGRSTARKTPSMESIDSSGEEEMAIQKLCPSSIPSTMNRFRKIEIIEPSSPPSLFLRETSIFTPKTLILPHCFPDLDFTLDLLNPTPPQPLFDFTSPFDHFHTLTDLIQIETTPFYTTSTRRVQHRLHRDSYLQSLSDRVSSLEQSFERLFTAKPKPQGGGDRKYTWTAELKGVEKCDPDRKYKLIAEIKGGKKKKKKEEKNYKWKAEIKDKNDDSPITRTYTFTSSTGGDCSESDKKEKKKDKKEKKCDKKVAPTRVVEIEEEPSNHGVVVLRQAFAKRDKCKGKKKELSPQDAAMMIQMSFREYLIRRSQALRALRSLAVAKAKLKEIRAMFNNFAYRRHLARDAEERQRFIEKIIVVILTVDDIEGADLMVRSAKRSMVDELEAMLDVIDPQPPGKSLSRRTFDMPDGLIEKEIAAGVAEVVQMLGRENGNV